MQIRTYQDAINAVNQVCRLEAVLKQLKEQLKAFVKNHGPVETEEQICDFFPSTKWVFSPEAKKEMAILIAVDGKNPYELLDFPASSLKELNWPEEVLMKFGTPVVSESFRFKKKSKK